MEQAFQGFNFGSQYSECDGTWHPILVGYILYTLWAVGVFPFHTLRVKKICQLLERRGLQRVLRMYGRRIGGIQGVTVKY